MSTSTNQISISIAAQVAGEIEGRLLERSRALVRTFPRNQPIASDSDPDSCLRRQVLEVVRWKDKAPIPAERQGRLEVGNAAERSLMAMLKEIGVEIVKEQMPFEIRHRITGEPTLRGRVEGFIRRGRFREIPVEVKSLVPHVFNRIERVEDLARFWWTKRYLAQMQSYLVGYGEPEGLFALTDLLGTWRFFPVGIDMDFAERILSFAEKTVEAVHAWRLDESALPPFSKDPLECRRCPFFGRVCNPPIVETGAIVVDDPDLESSLLRWSELRPGHAEFEALDRRIKARARTGRELQVVGEFLLRLIPRHRKAYSVPATDYSEVEIERAGQPGETS